MQTLPETDRRGAVLRTKCTAAHISHAGDASHVNLACRTNQAKHIYNLE